MLLCRILVDVSAVYKVWAHALVTRLLLSDSQEYFVWYVFCNFHQTFMQDKCKREQKYLSEVDRVSELIVYF